VNPDATAWFLCEKDFGPKGKHEWRWNWIEEDFLESSDATAWRAFWREHLPILFSVGMYYAYVALRFAEDGNGSVVVAYSPDFEGTGKVSDSFTHFCVLLTRYCESGMDPEFDFLGAVL
jgi:hypothetical protein